jgi:Ran-binding protein 1
LQFCIEQPISRCLHATIGKEEGLRMNRTAFTVMVKYSSLTEEVEEVLPEIDLQFQSVDKSLSKKEQMSEIRAEMKDDDAFKKLLQQYIQSSQVRIWIQEKKKNLSRKLEKTHNTEYLAELKKKKKADKAKKDAAKDEKDKKDEKTDEAADSKADSKAESESKEEKKDEVVQIETKTTEESKEEKKEDKEAKKDSDNEEKEGSDNDDEDDIKLTDEDKE